MILRSIILAAFALSLSAAVCAADATLGAGAADDTRTWTAPTKVPWKIVKWTLSAGATPVSGETVIFGEDGKFTPAGFYYFKLASDPEWFASHFRQALTNDGWKPVDAPHFKGRITNDQSILHRMCGSLKAFVGKLQGSKLVLPEVKQALFTPAWRDACEDKLRGLINERGMLGQGENEYPMAQSFHLLRSTFEDGRENGKFVREEQVWTLPNAQKLVRAILTEQYIISAEDRWLKGSPAYLESIKKNACHPDELPQRLEAGSDPILVKDGSVFFSGGLFIGWGSSHPSLHGTWDGLAIINIMFSHYPEPDPTKDTSIFYLWNKHSPEQREIGVRALTLLRRRLWLDFKENKGKCYCHIVNGVPSEQTNGKGEAERIYDHANYSVKDVAHWAYLSWNEMFGRPKGAACDGVQAFLAICDGRIWAPADRTKLDIGKLTEPVHSPK